MKKPKGIELFSLGFALIVLDQIIKILVVNNIPLHSAVPVLGNFFKLLYVQNDGMAFGMAFGGVFGKFLLSLFRIALSGFLIWWISKLRKKEDTPVGVLVGLTLITAGALGNIVDCFFYGIIWPDSLLVAGAPFKFMFGKVVDMFSFSIFPPVFNFADSCVTIGAFYLIIFQWKFFSRKDERTEDRD